MRKFSWRKISKKNYFFLRMVRGNKKSPVSRGRFFHFGKSLGAKELIKPDKFI